MIIPREMRQPILILERDRCGYTTSPTHSLSHANKIDIEYISLHHLRCGLFYFIFLVSSTCLPSNALV